MINLIDQKKYVEVGLYHKWLRRKPLDYIEYLDREEMFYRDNVRRGSRVLDVACGEGRTTVPLATAVGPKGKVIGIDFSQKAVGFARRNTEVLKNVEIYLMDARELDKLPGEFDHVLFLFNGLGYIPPENQVPLLRKTKRKLNDRGNILATVFSEYGAPAQLNCYQELFGPGSQRADGDFVYDDSFNYRAERFSAEKIARIFSQAGLKHKTGFLTKMSRWIKAS